MIQRFLDAKSYAEFAESAESNRELWRGMFDRARVPEEFVERARAVPGAWRFLVLAEDWCGDAFNSVPWLARLVEQVPGWELRILERDRNPDLMDSHLTNGSRSIPVVMVLDEDGLERGWWGPRPSELQSWFYERGREMEMDDRIREIRRWYARDRGRSTLDEVLTLVERAAEELAPA